MFRLYPGEEITTIEQHRFLTYFRPPSSADLPLIAFIPGAGHLARICYGHPEGKRSDFLSEWLGLLGYGLLAISYPSDDPEVGSNSGDLTIEEWAGLAARALERTIVAHHLHPKVIVCGWSMGGRIARALNVSLAAQSVQLVLFIALAATPPIPGLAPLDPATVDVRPSGFLDYRTQLDGGAASYASRWEKDLQDQSLQERGIIIPRHIYTDEYLAETPISLRGESDRFYSGRRYDSLLEAMLDMGSLRFHEMPIVGAIVPTSPRDAVHVLGDEARWTFFNTQKVLTDWIDPTFNFEALCFEKWERLCGLVLGIREKLIVRVHGNHFFFVGETGARETAYSISRLAVSASNLEREIREIVGGL